MKMERDPSLSSASRLQPGGKLLVRRTIRHRTWAGTIADRFKQRNGVPGWSPASLIHDHPARGVVVSFRQVSHFHSQRVSLAAQQTLNNSFAHTTVLMHGARIPEVTLLDRQVGAVRLTFKQSDLPLKDILARQLWRGDSVVHRAAVQYSLATAASNTHAAPAFVEALKIKRRFLKQEILGQDEPSSEIATQIVRRLRRVEERPATMPFDSLAPAPAIYATRNFVLESSRGTQVREIRAASGADTVPLPPPSAAFNVTQLTDEVMRQLDRRLIAARERLGKI